MRELLITIIIPVYNEGLGVEKLCKALKYLKGDKEIIFVDGGSTDETKAVIRAYGFTLAISPEKGRANQMNHGAALAKGNVLFFLHADSILPQDALYQITRIMSKRYKAGCFRLKFDSVSILMRICAFFSNTRVVLRGIAFGDQGIFIQRAYFNRLGGYRAIPLMEDYQLSMDVKKDGQRFGLAQGTIVTSERRFLKKGRLRTMWMMQRCQHMYRKGIDINEIAALYNRMHSE